MMHNPNSNKHKAQHCGYKTRITRQQVKATLDFFDITGIASERINKIIEKKQQKIKYTQLKINF